MEVVRGLTLEVESEKDRYSRCELDLLTITVLGKTGIKARGGTVNRVVGFATAIYMPQISFHPASSLFKG